MKKTARGFTLVELLVVIAIIGILVVAVMVVMNPLEMLRKSRDTTRLTDLNNLQQAINIAVQESSKSGDQVLCVGGMTAGACTGATYPSNANIRKNDGTGWVKVNLSSQNSVSVPTLPIDPTNNETVHYNYKSDGKDWEIDAVLESDTYVNQQKKMETDGGNDPAIYEVGSKLDLI